jgi:hypothetical protein
MNNVWATANGTVFYILLFGSIRQIDGNDDLLPTGITDVAGFVFHDFLAAWLDRFIVQIGSKNGMHPHFARSPRTACAALDNNRGLSFDNFPFVN